MKQYDIVCAGVACLDIVVSGNVTPGIFNVDSTAIEQILLQPGGDAVNESITAASLGMRTALVSCLGNDWKGDSLYDILVRRQVDTRYVERTEDAATVSSIVLVSEDGQRNFLFDRGCGSRYCPGRSALEAVRRTRLLSIASFFVQPRFDEEGAFLLLEEARRHDVLTVADVSCDTLGRGLSMLSPLFPLLDFFMPSLEEARGLSGKTELEEICRVLREHGAKNLVIKLGAEGCYLRTKEKAVVIPTFNEAPVVDTTGCGDNFVASFCYGLLNDFSLEDCALFANAAASINAGFMGGSGHLKSSEEVSDFLRLNKPEISI